MKPKFIFKECSLDRTNNFYSDDPKQEKVIISIELISNGNTSKISNNKILKIVSEKLKTIS